MYPIHVDKFTLFTPSGDEVAGEGAPAVGFAHLWFAPPTVIQITPFQGNEK